MLNHERPQSLKPDDPDPPERSRRNPRRLSGKNTLTKESPISSWVRPSICSAAGFYMVVFPFMLITITPSSRLVTISLYRFLWSCCCDIDAISPCIFSEYFYRPYIHRWSHSYFSWRSIYFIMARSVYIAFLGEYNII